MKRRNVPYPAPALTDDRVLSQSEVLERVPWSRQQLGRMVAANRFPKPIHLTTSQKGWRLSAVLKWMQEREARPIARRAYDFRVKDKGQALSE